MKRHFLKASVGWGIILWIVGYILGILLFPYVPTSLLGWIIMPIGVVFTLWVLFKKIHLESFQKYIFLSAVWLIIAVVCDYLFLVKIMKPVDGYYKFDVYLYYFLTATLPIIVGKIKNS